MIVTMDVAIGGSGSSYADTSDPEIGFKNGGARRLFFPLIQDIINVANFVRTKALEVAINALAAQNAAFTPATSVTPATLASSGDVAIDVGTGKIFPIGYSVKLTYPAAILTDYMIGPVKSYAAGILTITAIAKGSGAGSRSSWVVSPAGEGSSGVPATRTLSVAGGLLSGLGDLSADRTLTLSKASAAEWNTGTNDTKVPTSKTWADSFIAQDLDDGATIETWTANLYAVATLTLAGTARTFPNPTGMLAGQTYLCWIVDAGAGSFSITTFGSNLKGLPASLVTQAGKFYLLTAVCRVAGGVCACSLTGPY
jgi:hypothetical protein